MNRIHKRINSSEMSCFFRPVYIGHMQPSGALEMQLAFINGIGTQVGYFVLGHSSLPLYLH